jgi:hypothetical protein
MGLCEKAGRSVTSKAARKTKNDAVVRSRSRMESAKL